MIRQSLSQVLPSRHGEISPARIGRMVPLSPGVTSIGTPAPAAYGKRAMGIAVWRRRAPQPSLRQRLAGWRARNWRRIVLAWFVLSLVIMAVAAEPTADFPKAQARSVPAVRMILRVASGLTVAGVPVLLIVLP